MSDDVTPIDHGKGKDKKVTKKSSERKEPWTFGEMMGKAKAMVVRAKIQLDNTIPAQVEDLREQIIQAKAFDDRSNTPDTAPKLEKMLEDLIVKAQDTEVTFLFTSIPSTQYDAIIASCPPTKEQKKDNPRGNVNPDEFLPKLISAASLSPSLTIEQVKEMYASPNFPTAELNILSDAAKRAQETSASDIPLSVSGYGTTPSSAQNLDIASVLASLTQNT